jgi:tRNA modification GTPase
MPTTFTTQFEGSPQAICALATPPGKGALSIVRVSGRDAHEIAKQITHKALTPRVTHYTNFYGQDGAVIDQGLAIYFQAPASFTGEDVIELHCHGNPLISDLLLKTLCGSGARMANPGEFSLRAFLNNKIDLAQAEAIADLINSTTEQAARTATRSMQGAFSQRIEKVLKLLIEMRMHIEAHLDFPDEEINRQQSEQLASQLKTIKNFLTELLQQATLSERLQTGASIAIAGKPNAGKSTLLNVLAQSEVAIVTEIPGTTRDPLSADIEILGIPVRIIDTAGLRETTDIVESKGIERAQQVLAQADLILWLTDASNVEAIDTMPEYIDVTKVIYVHNKIDLQTRASKIRDIANENNIFISAKTHIGVEDLIKYIGQRLLGPLEIQEQGDTPFLARSRHIIALQQTLENLTSAQQHIVSQQELELAAEDLRLAQQNLGLITGEFTPDDLLGKIFSEFCIGK